MWSGGFVLQLTCDTLEGSIDIPWRCVCVCVWSWVGLGDGVQEGMWLVCPWLARPTMRGAQDGMHA